VKEVWRVGVWTNWRESTL